MKLKSGQKFRIAVTEEDLRAACSAVKHGGYLADCCPISQAVNATFETNDSYTCCTYGKVRGLYFRLSKKAMEFVRLWDNKKTRKTAKPFYFYITLTVKDQFLYGI